MPGEITNPQGSESTDVHGSLKAYLEKSSTLPTERKTEDTAATSPEDTPSVETPEVEVVDNESEVEVEVTHESQDAITEEGEGEEELSLDLGEDETSEVEVSEDFLAQDAMSKKIKIVSDGEEFEITVEEAGEGYQRLQDYTKKTQEVATLKRAYIAESEQLKQGMEMIQSFMAAELTPYESMDWEALKASDQTEFLVKQQEYQDAQAKVRGVYEAYQTLQQKQRGVQQDLSQETARTETAKLIQLKPELADKEKAKVAYTSWTKSAEVLGFQAQDLAGLNDHRVFLLLDKAAKYDALVAKQKGIKDKKVTNAPRTVQKGQTRDTTKSQSQRNSDAVVKRFSEEKSVDSAAALIAQRLRS